MCLGQKTRKLFEKYCISKIFKFFFIEINNGISECGPFVSGVLLFDPNYLLFDEMVGVVFTIGTVF